jgi:hypothetical protein
VQPGLEPMETYLVEHYRPGLDAESLSRAVAVIRQSAGVVESEGGALHYVRSTIVPGDEAFISIFEATSEALVREAYARAQLSFDRISKAIDEPPGGRCEDAEAPKR